MAKAHTDARPSIFRQLLALLLLALFLFPVPAAAAPYGADSYGDCKFQDGCPATTTGGATTTIGAGGSTTTPTSTTGTSDDTVTTGTGTTVILNSFEDFFSSTGIDVADLKVGDVVGFCIETTTVFEVCDFTKITYHTATLKSINLGAGTVVITIASTPTDYTLYLVTPLKIDIDKDGTDDIQVTLTNLSATTADINFRSLAVATPLETKDIPKATEASSLSWLWWLLGVLGFLSIIAIFKKRKGGDSGSGYGSGPMGGN